MNKPLHETIKVCRICGSNRIETFLELGAQPPANSLRDNLAEKLPLVPLSLCRCAQCATVQLTETVDPEHLFKHYVWVTGTSSTAKNYANLFCQEACKRLKVKDPFIIEVASNDGTFLRVFKDKGFRVLGIDPAENIVKMANDSGIPTLAAFFGQKVAEKVKSDKGLADFIFARNVIPHVANVHDVIAGMKHCLAPQGVGVIEFHYAGLIVDGLQYDSIYHEHLFYFSLKSIKYLLEQHGLEAFDLLESPISGGSLAIYFSHQGINKPVEARLKQKIKEEEEKGLNSKETWDKFADDCRRHKDKFVELILKEKLGKKSLIGYGSSARSSTLLNYCKIDKEHLICIADQNPLKHKKYTAGSDILIVSPDEAFSKNPDIIVLLAWNFKTEIISLLKNKYHFCGKVITPLPNYPGTLQL